MTEKPASKLPKDRLWQPVTARWFAGVFGLSLIYAIVRYHLAGDVAWGHFPLFILNKTTALAAVIFVASSYLIGPFFKWHNRSPSKLVVIKFCGLMGFSLAAIHAAMALCVLNPAYFAKYFEPDGRLNWIGELGMTLGIVGLWALTMPAITTLPMMAKEIGGWRWKRSQRMGYLSLLLVVAHLVVLGLRGWLHPAGWPAFIPPISLLAVTAALLALLVKLRRSKAS
jgi:DMSO/TMAO reductase YedYZ heme-binding membrane subunit